MKIIHKRRRRSLHIDQGMNPKEIEFKHIKKESRVLRIIKKGVLNIMTQVNSKTVMYKFIIPYSPKQPSCSHNKETEKYLVKSHQGSN